MPVANDTYKDAELVQSALDCRTQFLELKKLIHGSGVRLQQKVPAPRELISMSKVFTQNRDMAVRVLKAVDAKQKKDNKAENPTETAMRVCQVDDALASFLQLSKRGFRPIINDKGQKVWYYPDTLVLSYFCNWVVATGRDDGKFVKLFGKDDPFVQLFGDDMKKANSVPDGSAILDASGEQVQKFHRTKHMTLFVPHYPRAPRQVGKEYKEARIVISKEKHPEVYRKMEEERELLKGPMGKARKDYTDAVKRYKSLVEKKEGAAKVGDRSLDGHIADAQDALDMKRRAYMRILNEHGFEHNLKASSY